MLTLIQIIGYPVGMIACAVYLKTKKTTKYAKEIL